MGLRLKIGSVGMSMSSYSVLSDEKSKRSQSTYCQLWVQSLRHKFSFANPVLTREGIEWQKSVSISVSIGFRYLFLTFHSFVDWFLWQNNLIYRFSDHKKIHKNLICLLNLYQKIIEFIDQILSHVWVKSN